ncbi:hypothetical protein AHMF7605_20170 [Adhaeribacter arboris]|uniref:Tetratricopeptide repeat protein n=1 Tax=Adhaeribacter arboris TaxID=2072846 RepID=A0A2T2YJG8_9BACT|nr:hypothetical protein [Adhaeribacter arboris]PSR55656.1 hypothetical protein AHMF7605_20170 [Adhaeribacter arboris]
MYSVRDYDKKRNIINNIWALGFPPGITWRLMCLAYLFDEKFTLAEEYARNDYEASGGTRHGAANLIVCLATAGKKEEAEEFHQSIRERLAIPQFPFYLHAKANASLNRLDAAFTYLARAITDREYWLNTLKVSPKWDL